MSNFLRAVFTLAACILVAASPALRAYWVADGAPLCTAVGAQRFVCAASDGAGGAIVAWSDYRGGTADIYVQRVSASGVPMWTANGVAICTAANSQIVSSVVSDGAGGAIVAWYDGRVVSDDLYAQRVNASGAVQWTANGVAICTASGVQSQPLMIPDGGGGAIVVWQDGRSSGNDIYTQRVNGAGTVLWAANGVAVCTASGDQYWYKLATDGAGGVIVAWSDSRSFTSYDIYAQRVSVNGSVQWPANGVAVCTAANNQVSVDLASDGAGGAIIAWTDPRSTSLDIYAQRVNAAGTPQWTADGIPIYASDDDQSAPAVIADGAGGAIVGWWETRGAGGIYAQRLDASGVAQWSASGVLLGVVAATDALHGAPDGLGGAIFSWADVSGFADLFAQRVTGTGNLPWGSTPANVSAALDDQELPAIAPDGSGGAVIAWCDQRSGSVQHDIYAQLVDPLGRVGYLAPDIASVRDVPGDQGGTVFLSWDAARADLYMDATMSYYSIWRSISETQAALSLEKGVSEIRSLAELDPPGRDAVIRVEERGALTIYWQLVDTHDALFMEGYGMPVATLFDSSAYAGEPHYFQVVAHTTDPHVFWKSAAVSGWSIDNLPPGAPTGFVGEQSYEPIGLLLSWDRSTESDFSRYELYRGTSAGFVPGPANLVGEPDNAAYFDGEWSWNSGYCYKLAAFDVHGNESEFALFTPGDVTGAEPPKAPAASFLSQNVPNPFNPATRIAFGLGVPANVSLRIYDAAGRLVRTLVEGARPAGRYSELWDGRDARGASVASGVYFCRLDAGRFTQTRKMLLLR
jgi:hypothetical protein